MAILHVLVMVLSMAALQPTKSEVHIPLKQNKYLPSSGLNITCFVQNESFSGWYKVGFRDFFTAMNPWIPVVTSRAEVKDKPAVVIETDSSLKKTCTLIFPKGLISKSAGGKYACKGENNVETAEVLVVLNLDSVQTEQSLNFHMGHAEVIRLGAFSYPPAKFEWTKDKVPIDFNQSRLGLLQDDGSFYIRDVRKSDAGVYYVRIIWEKRVVKRVRIIVKVIDSRVFIFPSKQGRHIYSPSSKLSMMCLVQNETFVGWFKAEGNIKFPVVNSLREVKDKPVVVSHFEKYHELVLPRGLDTSSAGGKYVCKGETSEDTAVVYVKVNLDSLQNRQSLRLGTNGTIILGAFSYPRSRFKWKKDKVPVDFSQGRLTLQDDGSICIFNVQKSDAGVYKVKIKWENKVVERIRIIVTVIDSEVVVPFPKGTLYPLFGLSIACYIRNERFIGWFKADSNIKIPLVPSRADVNANKPAVVMTTVSKTTKIALLIFPKGSSVSNAGKYVCEGGIHQAVVKVIAK